MIRFAPLLLAASALAAPVQAAEFGLVVGVDDYVYQTPLKGAANDARDIALAMQGRDMARVEVLLNQAATKEAVTAAWNGLLADAGAGDTIIFTYAGHGAAEPDLNGDERTATYPDDDKDEAFLLANFTDRNARGFAERIVDDELNQWFAAAAAKGVRVVFVADSCHSGTMTRQSNSTRFAGAVEPPADAAAAAAGPVDLENVVFIAGAQQDQAVPEVSIAGQMRGATSYAFARALEGAADRDGDGVVTRDELSSYVAGVVANFSDQAQPSVLPLARGAEPVFGGPVSQPQAVKAAPRITLASASGALVGGYGADVVRDYGAATLNWNEATATVANAEGDDVAHNVLGKIQVRRVVDKFRLLEQVKAASAAAPFATTLAGGARILEVGEQVELSVGAREKPFLTVFTLSNIGRASLAYPFGAKEAGEQDAGVAVDFAFEITPDGVGVEHVIALATDEAPSELRNALRRNLPARRIEPLVASLLDGRRVEASVARVVTKAK
ncbi:MAG: caspase family protein [Pseudomonadota bacterium]